jgi:hypothetical protein
MDTLSLTEPRAGKNGGHLTNHGAKRNRLGKMNTLLMVHTYLALAELSGCHSDVFLESGVER